MKLRRYYEKPSERRAHAAAKAVRRARKMEREGFQVPDRVDIDVVSPARNRLSLSRREGFHR